MSEESQRVVVIHYASKDFSSSAIKWALNGFSLERGDELILLAIVNSSRGIFELDQKIVMEEVAKKKEEFHNNPSIRKISEQCETDKFRTEVLPGNLPEVAVIAAIRLKATSVILDRLAI
ncbi:putative receptor-like protein kinase [Sesbania bispinosa]|nr:putative receptor-like protein kinase [Sesbania bispinosa]